MKTDRKREWSVDCICVIAIAVLLWLEINAFWSGLLEGMEEGVVVSLSEALSEQELKYAGENGWQVEELPKGDVGERTEDGNWFLVYRETGEIHFCETEELMLQVSGSKKSGESLNLSLHKDFMGQFGLLFLLLSLIPVSIWILIFLWKKLCEIQRGSWQDALEFTWTALAFFLFFSLLLGALEIPREFLPQQNILDVRFYIQGVRSFFGKMQGSWKYQENYRNLRHLYQTGCKVYGLYVVGVWGGTIWLAVCRKQLDPARK